MTIAGRDLAGCRAKRLLSASGQPHRADLTGAVNAGMSVTDTLADIAVGRDAAEASVGLGGLARPAHRGRRCRRLAGGPGRGPSGLGGDLGLRQSPVRFRAAGRAAFALPDAVGAFADEAFLDHRFLQ
jgi:hypothetical protein